MITFIVVSIIFFGLVKIFIINKSEVAQAYKPHEYAKIVFELPREVLVNDPPEAIPILERERSRRKLLNQVFNLGLQSRRLLLEKQKEDLILERTPYYIPNKTLYVTKRITYPIKIIPKN